MNKILFIFLLLLLPSCAYAGIQPSVLFSPIADTSALQIKTSAAPNDTLDKEAPKDTLIPVNVAPLSDNSSFLDRKTIDRINYKYAGDLLNDFGIGYIRSHGLDGYPDETMLYGVGNNGISFFENGELLNGRLTNSFDLNNVQSEYIDSLEVLPLTRSFLFGIYNNSAAVNFITKDFIPTIPYSRIKYYQGPDGEAMIDAIFERVAYKKLKFSVDITNRKFDSSYVNSAYSQWMLRGKIKYYISNDWNVAASYNYVRSLVGLNGGVNVDTIISLGADVNTYLYQPLQVPVYFSSQNQSYRNHRFNLRVLGKSSDNSYTDLNIYYNFQETVLNNSTDTLAYKNIDKEKLAGLNLQQKIKVAFADITILGNYESGKINYYSLLNGGINYYPVKYSIFSIAPVISTNLFDSSFVPSVFFKYSRNSYADNVVASGSFAGWGGDLTYNYSNEFKLYAGFSNYKPGPSEQFIYNYELGAGYRSEKIGINLTLFKRNNYFDYNRFGFITDQKYIIPDLYGSAVDLKASIWKFALETHAYFYGSSKITGEFYSMPKINMNGGIYYENILFKNNLNLKTGFSIYYIGKRIEPGYGQMQANSRIDFTLAGEIQKVAYVYFTWENLLDAQYYIIPYYPVPARNIRFGIAWELFN